MEAFILAGGASRRMGTDKSQLLIERQTFAERIAETLLQVADSVKLVGGLGSNFPRVADVYPQWGALGGLRRRKHALPEVVREHAPVQNRHRLRRVPFTALIARSMPPRRSRHASRLPSRASDATTRAYVRAGSVIHRSITMPASPSMQSSDARSYLQLISVRIDSPPAKPTSPTPGMLTR